MLVLFVQNLKFKLKLKNERGFLFLTSMKTVWRKYEIETRQVEQIMNPLKPYRVIQNF